MTTSGTVYRFAKYKTKYKGNAYGGMDMYNEGTVTTVGKLHNHMYQTEKDRRGGQNYDGMM